MKKIRLSNGTRKIVAFTGFCGGLWLRQQNNLFAHIYQSGVVGYARLTMEQLISDSNRLPIYEGDTIEITF